jgi:ligand-binding SRPBCC domain-containing protein
MHPATYTVAPFGLIRVKWVTEITHLVDPFIFVDEQRFGPYRFWHHQHHFRELENGVEMQDIIHYSIPFDPFSRLLSGPVARRLEYIFDYRRTALGSMFGMKVE